MAELQAIWRPMTSRMSSMSTVIAKSQMPSMLSSVRSVRSPAVAPPSARGTSRSTTPSHCSQTMLVWYSAMRTVPEWVRPSTLR